VARLVADVSRAKALLGYEPRVSLSEGLQHLLHWYGERALTPEQLLEQEVLHNWVSTSGVA
jgi:UDP-glucose 4-epimerase